eukprot:SAG11_NODE_193_length_12862_cov_7.128888_6_plen_183_part_00
MPRLWQWTALRLPDVLGPYDNTGRQSNLLCKLASARPIGTRIWDDGDNPCWQVRGLSPMFVPEAQREPGVSPAPGPSVPSARRRRSRTVGRPASRRSTRTTRRRRALQLSARAQLRRAGAVCHRPPLTTHGSRAVHASCMACMRHARRRPYASRVGAGAGWAEQRSTSQARKLRRGASSSAC